MDFSFFLSKAYIKFIHVYIELQREQGGVQLPQHHLLSASFSGFHLQVFLNEAMEKTLTPPSLNTTPHHTPGGLLDVMVGFPARAGKSS